MTVWLLVSVLVLVTLALGATLWLFVTLKRQVWQSATETSARHAQLVADYNLLQAAFDDLQRAFAELEQRSGMLVAPAPTASGLNINRRTQALRMLRRGDDTKQVSAALNLPQSEVALLEKVRTLSSS